MPDPDTELQAEIASHHAYLLRYAKLHLRDAARAEDAVQDTIVAALAQRATFAGRAKLRTWLTVILRNKIVDQLRRFERDRPVEDAERLAEEGAAAVADEFTASGSWAEMPGKWEMPEAALQSTQFWRVYEECCKRMPARYALVFSMREVMGLTSDEICKELGISASNLHVVLFRARLRLRTCMTRNWFEGERG